MDNNEIVREPYVYFALDSDVLRHLTDLDRRIKMSPDNFVDQKSITDNSVLRYNFGYLWYIYKQIKDPQSHYRFMVTNTVYQENKHSETLINFVKENLYVPNINSINVVSKAEQADKLAQAYVEGVSFTLKGTSVNIDAPMAKVWNTFSNRYIPSNDAYIMAEATVEGVCLITFNGKDFVFDKRNDYNNNDKRNNIWNINKTLGFYQSFGNLDIVPGPYRLQSIVPVLKNVDYENIYISLAKMPDVVKGSDLDK